MSSKLMKAYIYPYTIKTMKAFIFIVVLLISTSTYSICKDVDKAVECCLTDKETIIGKWNYKQDKKDIDIYFKWDGRMYLTDYLYSESKGVIKTHYVGEWTLVDNTLTMLIDNNAIKYQIKFNGINTFSLMSLTTVTTYVRVW